MSVTCKNNCIKALFNLQLLSHHLLFVTTYEIKVSNNSPNTGTYQGLQSKKDKMFRIMIWIAAIYLLPICMAFVNNYDSLSLRSRIQIEMNTDQIPTSPTSKRQSTLKKSLFGMGSLLSVALLKREKALAIELPECSDSVTILRRNMDNREVCYIFEKDSLIL